MPGVVAGGPSVSSRSQYDVFLSYARTDDQDGAIRGLAEEMRDVFYRRTDHELRIFVDHRDIRVSEAWRQKIEDALRSSTVIVPVVTRAYLKSDWCRREWNYFAGVRSLASDPDLHLIYPVLLDGIPQLVKSEPAREWLDEVSSLEYVDLRGSGSGTQRHAAQVARLMDSVMTALHQVNAQESTSAQSTEEQHLDALTGYVRDRSRFVHLLAEALNTQARRLLEAELPPGRPPS